MSALWLTLAFVAGCLFWNWTGRFILRRVLRRADDTMKDALSGLPQESLLKVHDAAHEEIERRRKGLVEVNA